MDREDRAVSLPGAIARAPGRVNLIGEHTDYNEGLVLPVAIDLEVLLEVEWGRGGDVRLERGDDGERAMFDLSALPGPGGAWHDYVAGVAWAMAEAGLPVHGFAGRITSKVPIGAGLSSSAALELAAAWALSGPHGPTVGPMALARIAQRAENEHVGVRCGLMDQFASACGLAGHALFLDCRTLDWHPVAVPEDVTLVIAHTGVPRALGSSAYNDRRADCERAVAFAARQDPGVTALRDVDMPMLESIRDELEPRVYDRAHHVITENQRVVDVVAALERGDLPALGDVFAASHASLRDRYEVSCPELDALVDLAVTTPGVVASRMTGAGFGGCTVSLSRPDAVARLRARIDREYPALTGRTPRTWVVRAVDGAGFLDGPAPS